MGKVRKVRKKYNYNKNRRREWKKREKKSAVGCVQLKESWDESKTLSKNLQEMGLVLDPNKLLAVPSTKDNLGPRSVDKCLPVPNKSTPPKSFVITELEKEANRPQESHAKLSESEVLFCTHMLDRYGDDYKAMARDYRNYYQDTPKQIKRRINAFKNIPDQYNAYLESKKSTSKRNNT